MTATSGRTAQAATTWFITGASKGFGRERSLAALERGDSVAATAPDASTLIGLGDGPSAIAEADYRLRLATWREWEAVSVAAHGDPG